MVTVHVRNKGGRPLCVQLELPETANVRTLLVSLFQLFQPLLPTLSTSRAQVNAAAAAPRVPLGDRPLVFFDGRQLEECTRLSDYIGGVSYPTVYIKASRH